MSAVAELDRKSKGTGPHPSASECDSAASDGLVITSSESSGVSVQGSTVAMGRAQSPSEEQLLDALYEVLVQGVPPRSTLTRETVELFLHQHARQTKPVSEMLAFFEQYGLPTDPHVYGADRELGELASGLQRERNSLLPGFGPAEPSEPERLSQTLPQTLSPNVQPAVVAAAPASSTSFPSAFNTLEGEKTGRRAPPVRQVARASTGLRWLVGIAALMAVAALTAFALNYKRAISLEQRLDQARMQQRSTDVALTKLEQRAESLQGELKQSEAERVQQTTQLQTTLEEQAKRRATEEQAVERLLGPRYLKLRQKYSDQAAAAPKPVTP